MNGFYLLKSKLVASNETDKFSCDWDRLDGPGIKSRWGDDIFRTRLDRSWGSPNLLAMGTASFQGVMRPERSVDHPPPSNAEVKERVELYLYSHSGPSWLVPGWNLALPLPEILFTEHTVFLRLWFRLAYSGNTWQITDVRCSGRRTNKSSC
jgi:hypothetical protein